MFVNDPELLAFFFLVRLARIATRLFKGSIALTPRRWRAVGLGRFVKDGEIYYTYKGGCYPQSVAQGSAMQHIKQVALDYCTGRGLDIGASRWPFPGAHGVDDRPEENAYRLDRWAPGSLDFVFSSHCLEHLEEWQKALSLWISKLRPGGILFLYLPHKSMTLWEPGSPWVGDGHKWSPTVAAITPILEAGGMEIIKVDPGPDGYFSFHIVGRKT
jgi:SAM-dependent methyltransferase